MLYIPITCPIYRLLPFMVAVLCSLVSDSCSVAEFACLSGECLSSSVVCDGNANCMDRSDEMGCGTLSL